MSTQEFSHPAKGESSFARGTPIEEGLPVMSPLSAETSGSIIKAAASQDNCPDCGLPEEKHRLSAEALAACEEDKAEENPRTCRTAAEIASHLESL